MVLFSMHINVAEKSNDLLFIFPTNSTATGIKWSEQTIGSECPLLRGKKGLFMSASLKSTVSTAFSWPEGNSQNFQRL